MKPVYILLTLLLITACKQKNQEPVEPELQEEVQVTTTVVDTLDPEQAIQSLKREQLYRMPDDSEQLAELVMEKEFFKETDEYILDFHFPWLNEDYTTNYRGFNDRIAEYIDIMGTEAQILEDKAIYCDTIGVDRLQEERKIRYKIYTRTDQLLSVVFYKENYYAGALHPTYLFDCFNYDLVNFDFKEYSDYFTAESDDEVLAILNRYLKQGTEGGDCWEMTAEDFAPYRNNFVFGDKAVKFYFDDCVICPSYTGTFSIEVPLDQIMPYLKQFQQAPEVGQ